MRLRRIRFGEPQLAGRDRYNPAGFFVAARASWPGGGLAGLPSAFPLRPVRRRLRSWDRFGGLPSRLALCDFMTARPRDREQPELCSPFRSMAALHAFFEKTARSVVPLRVGRAQRFE